MQLDIVALIWNDCSNWLVILLPANTTILPNVWPMVAHRLRRWPTIGQALGRCVVFSGLGLTYPPDNA